MQTDSDHASYEKVFLARLVSVVAVGWLLVAALPWLCPSWWLGDLVANLRVQLVIAGFVVLAVTLFTRRWKTLAVVAAACLYHSSWFLLTGPISEADPSASTSITVMAANVYTGNTNFDEIEQLFRDSQADVIVVSELSFGLARALHESFVDEYPHVAEFPADRGNFGMGLYSRLPLQETSIEFLNGDTVPTIFADVEADGHVVHLVGVHTLPPLGGRMFEHRNQHLQQIANRVQQRKEASENVSAVVLGDFNLTPWSPVFHRFLADANLNQAIQGNRLQPTWYRWPVFPFGLVLDHVLLSDDMQCVTRTIEPSAGSDHCFVTVQAGFLR